MAGKSDNRDERETKRWLPALDDRPGPARSISAARAGAIVDGALGRAFAPAASRSHRRSGRVAFALAATLAVGGAAAATFAWKRGQPPPAPAPTESPRAAGAQAPPPLSGVDRAALHADSPSTVPAAPAPLSALSSPSPEAPPAPSNASTPLHASRAPSADSADLLARANELRGARRWKDAAQAYERVLSVHPSSPEAYAARVAAADLHLDQLRDPGGALRLYRAARGEERGGPLAEQILWGIARSTRALGDASAEEAALQDYLSRFPAGLFGPDARHRLAQLGAPP